MDNYLQYSFEIGKSEDTAQLRSLWEICFPEDAEFTRFYFDKMYSPSASRIIRAGDNVCAALYVFPYSFVDCSGRILNSYYIYGVGTDPQMRGHGLASRLIEKTLGELRGSGADLCMLVPQNKGLFAFYEKLGFMPAFGLSCREQGLTNSGTAEIRAAVAEDVAALNQLYEMALLRKAHVLRTCEEWKLLLAELELAKGAIYIAERNGEICAFCMYTEEGDMATAAEIIAVDERCKGQLLNSVLTLKNKEVIRCYEPGEDFPYGAFYALSSKGREAMKNSMDAYMNLMHS